MANENQYYKFPFAEDGNFSVIPDQASGGSVDYESGFGPDYEKVDGEADRKLIERETFNGLMNGVTKNIKQWQERNYPTWIEDDGDGVAFGYDRNMIVSHNGQLWVSLFFNNVDEPVSGGGRWVEFDPARVVFVSGNGGELGFGIEKLKNTVTSSVGVSGGGGDLSQSLTDLQSVIDTSETFQNATPSASTQSVTLPNGLIMKFGIFTESDNASDSRSWDVAFPNGVLSMTVTPNTDLNATGGLIVSYDNSSFVFKAGDNYGNNQTAFVQAIGY